MKNSPRLVDADRSYQPGKPELRVDIDRERAADLGVRVAGVSQTLNTLMAGQEVTTFNAGKRPVRRRAARRRTRSAATPDTLAPA